MRWLKAVAVMASMLAALGCRTGRFEPPPMASFPPQTADDHPPTSLPRQPIQACHPAKACPSCRAPRLELNPQHPIVSLPPGRWALRIAIPSQRLITLGIVGARDGLIDFQIVARGSLVRLRTGSFADDRLLPTFVGLESAAQSASAAAVVDVRRPVRVFMFHYDSRPYSKPPRQLLLRQRPKDFIPLIALPAPSKPNAGYRLQSAPRYLFVRADVAAALRSAFQQTRKRYKRRPIYIGDASQWNGERPATDLGQPRHISHAEGRDVDIGLPVKNGSRSLLKRRCQGTLVENDRLVCAPGTSRELDVERLAYLLAVLIEGPTRIFTPNPKRRPGPFAEVETIFLDQVYIDQIRKVLPKLRRQKWIHDEAYQALGTEGLLRHSPWHVDHAHIRFSASTIPVQLHPFLVGTEIPLPTAKPKEKPSIRDISDSTEPAAGTNRHNRRLSK